MMNNRNKIRPPFLVKKLFEVILAPYTESSELGDAEERFFLTYEKYGLSKAKMWYRKNFILSLPRNIKNTIIWSFIMYSNYIKIAFRNFIKNKSFSIINVTGLTIGMAGIIFIFLWVNDELSYDNYHNDADDLYRIVYSDGINKQVKTHTALAAALKSTFPEVVETARMMPSAKITFKSISKDGNTQRVFYENTMIIADPSLLDVFEYKFIKGDRNSAFSSPDNLVITERMAMKYFGDEDPIGNSLYLMAGSQGRKVSAVIENPPSNTHLKFDIIIHFGIMDVMGFDTNSWDETYFFTYIRLAKDTDRNLMSSKIENFINNYRADNKYKVILQPVQDIYLHSDFGFDLAGLGDSQFVYIFTCAAIIILTIACINFINLSTARYLPRSKEVGMRKIVGAKKGQLIIQYIGESVMVSVFAILLAIAIVKYFLPEFNNFTGKNLSFNILNTNIGLTILGIIFITGILGGLYPAIFMASFKPINILKGKIQSGNFSGHLSNNSIRKVLVVMQFIVSVVLIAGSIIINNQLNYIKDKKLGFQKENIVYLPMGTIGNDYHAIKQELMQDPNITGIALSNYLTTDTGNEIKNVEWEGKDPGAEVLIKYKDIGYDYLNLLGIEMKEGRDFSREFQADSSDSFIVNEKFVEQYEISDPIGKRLDVNGKKGEIIGVVENVYYLSLYNEIEPMIHGLFSDLTGRRALIEVIYIRIDGQNVTQALDKIVNTWKKIVPNIPPEYYFLDAEYDKIYKTEQVMGTLIFYFTLFGILIACMGLFGLTAYVTEQRLKEICVRKILGASKKNILINLSNDFLKWVVLAIIIGIPVSYFALNTWLENFAYKINIDWKIFLFSAVSVLIIASITLSYHIIKAIRANPADSLRYE